MSKRKLKTFSNVKVMTILLLDFKLLIKLIEANTSAELLSHAAMLISKQFLNNQVQKFKIHQLLSQLRAKLMSSSPLFALLTNKKFASSTKLPSLS